MRLVHVFGQPLSLRIVYGVHKPFPHYGSLASADRVGNCLAGNSLEHLLLYAVRLPYKAYPFWQIFADTFFNCHLNLLGIHKGKVVHGQNTIAVYDCIAADERDRLRVMVVWRWNMILDSVHAASTSLQPTIRLPEKQLLAVNAQLSGILHRYESIPFSSCLINLVKIFHVNMIPFPGSICQRRSGKMSN